MRTTSYKGIKTKELWKNPEYREHMRKAHMGQTAWNKGKKTGLVPTTAFKKGDNVGDTHWAWKGDDVQYRAVHTWVTKWKGSPETCEKCGKTELKGHKIHWANIDHKYSRVLDDYIRLCAKCHWEYDKTIYE